MMADCDQFSGSVPRPPPPPPTPKKWQESIFVGVLTAKLYASITANWAAVQGAAVQGNVVQGDADQWDEVQLAAIRLTPKHAKKLLEKIEEARTKFYYLNLAHYEELLSELQADQAAAAKLRQQPQPQPQPQPLPPFPPVNNCHPPTQVRLLTGINFADQLAKSRADQATRATKEQATRAAKEQATRA